MQTSSDGHTILDGARWHIPAPGDPSRCIVAGCTRILGEARRVAALAAQFDEIDESA